MFCADNPAALEVHIEEDFKISQTKYSLLYSVYSFPNIFLPFFGGILLDKIGIRNGMIVVLVLALLGQSIQAYGGYKYSFGSLIIGRFFFGMGAENEYVVQNLFLSKWFRDGEMLALATGLGIGVPYLFNFYSGSAVSSIYIEHGLGASFNAGVYVAIMSLIAGIILYRIDQKVDFQEEIPIME
jgi:MFS family permease